MGKINVLSFAVANLIAAGEVVDRPASVIKELIENSIDSGASQITVEIQNGGVTLMRVSDNGSGIAKDDLPIAVRRHATSKIKDEADLCAIMTLGFRGEALAAIAAVSDLRIISKPKDQANGAAIEVSGGVIIGVGDRAARDGTTVMVENLFANVPARRKFLKKDITETMAVTAVVEKIALSHPEIAFRLITDGNVRLETAGDGKLKSAIYAVFGKDFTKALLEVSGGVEGIKVSGFCGRTDNCKSNRNFQNFFINGRYVKSRTAQAAIEQAYVSYIPQEKFPVCAINIEINPAMVDVNVHPSKLEVKFSNEKPVFEAVYYSVRAALEQNVTRPEMRLGARSNTSVFINQINTPKGVNQAPLSVRTEPIREGREESLSRRQLGIDVTAPELIQNNEPSVPLYSEKTLKTTNTSNKELYTHKQTESLRNFGADDEKERTVEKLQIPEIMPKEHFGFPKAFESLGKNVPPPMLNNSSMPNDTVKMPPMINSIEETRGYRIIGEAFNSYVFVERGDKVIVIDKHAAHERIIFERLRKNMELTDISSQLLMMPVEVMLRSDEINMLEQYRSEIESVGFGYTTGRNSVSITELPEVIDIAAASDMISEIADKLLHETGTVGITRDIIFEKALYQASCKAAIKAGREYSKEEISLLVETMMKLEDITFCPHGRPVAMEISKRSLDRQFSRS